MPFHPLRALSFVLYGIGLLVSPSPVVIPHPVQLVLVHTSRTVFPRLSRYLPNNVCLLKFYGTRQRSNARSFLLAVTFVWHMLSLFWWNAPREVVGVPCLLMLYIRQLVSIRVTIPHPLAAHPPSPHSHSQYPRSSSHSHLLSHSLTYRLHSVLSCCSRDLARTSLLLTAVGANALLPLFADPRGACTSACNCSLFFSGVLEYCVLSAFSLFAQKTLLAHIYPYHARQFDCAHVHLLYCRIFIVRT